MACGAGFYSLPFYFIIFNKKLIKDLYLIKNIQAFILSYNQYKTSSIIASFLTENSIIDAICYRAKKDSKAFGSDFMSVSKIQISLYQNLHCVNFFSFMRLTYDIFHQI